VLWVQQLGTAVRLEQFVETWHHNSGRGCKQLETFSYG
jgi:hypothetical protein